MTKPSKNSLPPKLIYKGFTYHRTAITEEGRLWKDQVTPRLEMMHEIASDGEIEDHEKKAQIARLWLELREYFKLLGLQ